MSNYFKSHIEHPGYIAGRTYATVHGPSSISAAAPAAVDTIYFYPFICPATLAFVSGFIRVSTGGAGSAVKAGIWANSSVSNRALGAPLFVDNTGAATTATANVTMAIGAGVLAQGNMYWIGTKFTGTLPSVYALGNISSDLLWLAGSTSPIITGLTIADAYANNMPTIAEAAAFGAVQASIPTLYLNT